MKRLEGTPASSGSLGAQARPPALPEPPAAGSPLLLGLSTPAPASPHMPLFLGEVALSSPAGAQSHWV